MTPLNELQVALSRRVGVLEAQQKAIWEAAGKVSRLRRSERQRVLTPQQKQPQVHHGSRSLIHPDDPLMTP